MAQAFDLPNFAEEIRALIGEEGKRPPVESWHPQRKGEIAIRIDRDGQWFYQDEAMTRESVPRLFSGILRYEGGEYYLVSPVEQLKIEVADVPFIVRLMDREGEGKEQRIHFSTNMGDNFSLSEEHPLRIELDERGAPLPYVLVRNDLWARLNTAVYYELAELAEEGDQTGQYGVWSCERFFVFE